MDYQDFLYNQFPDLLSTLNQDTQPLWGLMNAQQLVEHLTIILACSNGHFDAKPIADVERMAYRKMRYYEKDVPMPRNFRTDFMPETPHPVKYPNIEIAKIQLKEELVHFKNYYAEHLNLTAMHPVLGLLNYEEWLETHARHFRHHLQQFGVLPLPIEV
jgi:hydroxymethylglutaryl-CoA reductase